MPLTLPVWLGNIHDVLCAPWAPMLITAASIICGGLIGADRERADKPAGIRTLILICLGASMFTQASLLIGGPNSADPSRIAAQIVSGIGFLGAGAIIRVRGLVIGVTTGAAIWATAAVGILLGAGQVAGGLALAIVVYITLAVAGRVESFIIGSCRFTRARLSFDPRQGKSRVRIQHIVGRYYPNSDVSFDGPGADASTAMLRYCNLHRHHTKVLNELAMLKSVKGIEPGE